MVRIFIKVSEDQKIQINEMSKSLNCDVSDFLKAAILSRNNDLKIDEVNKIFLKIIEEENSNLVRLEENAK